MFLLKMFIISKPVDYFDRHLFIPWLSKIFINTLTFIILDIVTLRLSLLKMSSVDMINLFILCVALQIECEIFHKQVTKVTRVHEKIKT